MGEKMKRKLSPGKAMEKLVWQLRKEKKKSLRLARENFVLDGRIARVVEQQIEVRTNLEWMAKEFGMSGVNAVGNAVGVVELSRSLRYHVSVKKSSVHFVAHQISVDELKEELRKLGDLYTKRLNEIQDLSEINGRLSEQVSARDGEIERLKSEQIATSNPSLSVSKAPPLGCKPRKFHESERRMELIGSIQRYAEAQLEVNPAWIEELADLNKLNPDRREVKNLNIEAGEREDSFRGLQESNTSLRHEIEELKCKIAGQEVSPDYNWCEMIISIIGHGDFIFRKNTVINDMRSHLKGVVDSCEKTVNIVVEEREHLKKEIARLENLIKMSPSRQEIKVAFAKNLIVALREKSAFIHDAYLEHGVDPAKPLIPQIVNVIMAGMCDYGHETVRRVQKNENPHRPEGGGILVQLDSNPRPPNADMPTGTKVTVTSAYDGKQFMSETAGVPYKQDNGIWCVSIKTLIGQPGVAVLELVKPILFKTEFGATNPEKDHE